MVLRTGLIIPISNWAFGSAWIFRISGTGILTGSFCASETRDFATQRDLEPRKGAMHQITCVYQIDLSWSFQTVVGSSRPKTLWFGSLVAYIRISCIDSYVQLSADPIDQTAVQHSCASKLARTPFVWILAPVAQTHTHTQAHLQVAGAGAAFLDVGRVPCTEPLRRLGYGLKFKTCLRWPRDGSANVQVFRNHPMLVHFSCWWFGTFFYFPIYWVSNHPNWLSYFSEGFKPPTSFGHVSVSVSSCVNYPRIIPKWFQIGEWWWVSQIYAFIYSYRML